MNYVILYKTSTINYITNLFDNFLLLFSNPKKEHYRIEKVAIN